MIFGTAVKVTDFTEASAALQQILDKYTPGYYTQTLSGSLIEKYRSAHDNNAVAVYRIEPQEMTVKENAVAEV